MGCGILGSWWSACASIGRTARFPVGTHIELAGPGIPNPLLWSGWSWPEDDGTWSVGSRSVLRVPPLDVAGELVDIVIELADVFVRPGQDPLAVEIVVGDGPRHRWLFDRTGPHERRLSVEPRDSPTWVSLRMPAAVSCSSLGESADTRRLGCKVAAIAIVPRSDDSSCTEHESPGAPRRFRRAVRRHIGRDKCES